jgi:DNA-binding GntR family transcriptional regulator
MILAGELKGGAPLRLAELAARLEMSQMPVREALRSLSALGVVEIVPHKGAHVRELTEDDLQDTHETRLALESLAVSRAAERFTPELLHAAREALAQHEALLEAGDLASARAAHTEFHFAIYHGSGSRWLPRAIEPVWQNGERYRFAAPSDASRRAEAHEEHQTLLDACAANDPERAVEALRVHLAGTTERILAGMFRS